MSAGLRGNPFFVLELPVTAGPREVEREAARLLGMLELGLGAAATYRTPMGMVARRAEDVRAAAAALRDPRRRLVAELWAAGGVEDVTGAGTGTVTGTGTGAGTVTETGTGTETGTVTGTVSIDPGAGWTGAFAATGWERR